MRQRNTKQTQATWKRTKRLAVILVTLLCLGLSGCSGLDNTEIVLTTGLSGNQLFKVGSSACTLPEAMIYVDAYVEQYETVYGVEMWSHDFGGITFEEYVKNDVISQLATVKAITLLAEEYEVALNEEEEEQVKEAAKEYYESLGQEERDWMKLKEKNAEALFYDHLLAEKVYEEITKDVNTEVSDDEARVITVQQIFLETTRAGESGQEALSPEEKQEVYERARDILMQIEEGREFQILASVYHQGEEQSTVTFGRGEREQAYEDVAFALEKDQVSPIIETQKGYYILKCTENFNREATEENRVTMLEKRRDTVFSQVYDEFIANEPSEFNTRLWKKVSLENHTLEHTGENFFTIYEKYFGE